MRLIQKDRVDTKLLKGKRFVFVFDFKRLKPVFELFYLFLDPCGRCSTLGLLASPNPGLLQSDPIAIKLFLNHFSFKRLADWNLLE